MKAKVNLSNIKHYLVGNLRYKLFWSKFPWLLRYHILEQIEHRLEWMDDECYDTGSCKECGCQTTMLQMANKSCDKPCYPPMMNKERWEIFKAGWTLYDEVEKMQWQIVKGKLISKNYKNHVGDFT